MNANKKKSSRFKLVLAGVLAAAALLLGWCGRGWLGGGDEESSERDTEKAQPTEPESETTRETETPTPQPCQLRVDATGIQVEGEPVTVEQAISRCMDIGAAELVVTGDAVYGTVEKLRVALSQAGVTVQTAAPPPQGR